MKHERICDAIREMELGRKISVRSLAREMDVSEATAYKAIKKMEDEGYLETLPRAGTIRVESPREKQLESITYKEVLRIVDGELLAGEGGLDKTVSRFNIGAMTLDAMKKYLHPGGLLIAGNRDDVHLLALSSGVGVLVTGGFSAEKKVIEMADRLKLPVISTPYDSFTTGSLISRAISEKLIKSTIPYVGDLLKKAPAFLRSDDTVRDFKAMSEKTDYEKFPVVDHRMKVLGVVSTREVVGKRDDESIEKVMRKVAVTYSPRATVSHIAHVMDWENLQLCPITEGDRLVGVITRTDILKALQDRDTRPMEKDTLEDRVIKDMELERVDGQYRFNGSVTPDMLDPYGNASNSVLSMFMVKSAMTVLENRFYSCTMDSVSLDFMGSLEVDSEFTVEATILSSGKNRSKIGVRLLSKASTIAVGTLSALHTPEERE